VRLLDGEGRDGRGRCEPQIAAGQELAHPLPQLCAQELAAGHVPGAVLLPLDRLSQEVDDLALSGPVAIVCRGGYRSSIAGSCPLASPLPTRWISTGGKTRWSLRARASETPSRTRRAAASVARKRAMRSINAAGTGARIALLDHRARAEIERLVRRVEKIETAVEPRFQEHFVKAMAIPHDVDPYARLAQTIRLPVRRTSSSERPARPRRRERGTV